MPDIYHDLTVNVPVGPAFVAISQPEGLNAWWTLACEGEPTLGTLYRFYFGPEFDWHARVIELNRPNLIAWRFTQADEDWTDTLLRLGLNQSGGITHVRFEHTGWPACNDHFRRSSYCWAQYLRLFKHYVEQGLVTPYYGRLNA